ncbi:DUF445 domain-containing protein [Acinetobacter pollinis]|uniref:DUF445 domain-containing protein n=1 Tax=Acinetobacter pollinis TaxID=2605270 RepID=UPI0018A2F655|nr:DUF445 family protein [Acinetobacter pollinis]MBF7691492.1 DUF445 family protein [Acinetobacter pollinis]MBF7693328.1 DUF445 family protein [Acinetobacter pollinis]MBF7699174.1 DUF445 family protein [Acinetobacter pollinis]MBF7701529.1 DUF445 family protein [Acinetobacter pollinis]
METTTTSTHLKRSQRLATMALVTAILVWIVFMVAAKLFPEYAWWIHILMLAAEAGVVGGFADWYAVTVLFRNPFGKIPIPHFLRDHTEIIPRNKARIAESMGRFVQENFLSPQIVEKSLSKTDLTLSIGQWLENPNNSTQVTQVVQQTLPKVFDFVEQEQIAQFIQNNSVQWIQNTKINRLASEMLHSILDNDFHQDVLQRALDYSHEWVLKYPEKTRDIVTRIFKEMGILKLSKGVSWLGIDMEQRTVDSFMHKLEEILKDPEHPWRQHIEDYGQSLIGELKNDESAVSMRLNSGKNALLENPHVLNFMTGAVVILFNAIKEDLLKENSGIAMNMRAAIELVGKNLAENKEVRQLLNTRLITLATYFSDQYSDKVIRFISQRIHEWDSTEMIAKIENSVGGDLHMIRVNGVIVGAFIGLILGVIRALVDYLL